MAGHAAPLAGAHQAGTVPLCQVMANRRIGAALRVVWFHPPPGQIDQLGEAWPTGAARVLKVPSANAMMAVSAEILQAADRPPVTALQPPCHWFPGK